jgi:hypothetical protein
VADVSNEYRRSSALFPFAFLLPPCLRSALKLFEKSKASITSSYHGLGVEAAVLSRNPIAPFAREDTRHYTFSTFHPVVEAAVLSRMPIAPSARENTRHYTFSHFIPL